MPIPDAASEKALSTRSLGAAVNGFALVALTAHVVLALHLRVVAWPEIVTPGYLWSRGMLMYRNIKLEHTPATTGTLALGFLLFGARTAFVRAYAVLPPLVAHGLLLRETRGFSLTVRALSSAFFLAVFFGSDGNAVWPTVVMTALAIPIAAAASRGRFRLAGVLFGIAILFKQTAAYALVLAALVLLLRRRFRDAATLFLAGCAPYFVTLLLFALLGAGRDMLRWTILVPLTIRPAFLTVRPGLGTAATILFGFAPLSLEALLERPGEHATSARWLLIVAAGLALICYPRFDVLQTVASTPCLAVGAARLMSRRPAVLSRCAMAFAATLTLSRGAVLAVGGNFDGRVLFWNDEPAFNRLITRLQALPPGARVFSQLWGNVNPRADRLPPGDIYQHPWFDWFFAVDRTGERLREAAARPGTIIVGYRGARPGGEIVGPYAIWRVAGAAGPSRSR